MKRLAKLMSLIVGIATLFITGSAQADLFYVAQGGSGEPQGVGYIQGMSERGTFAIDNIGRTDVATGADGKPRLLIMSGNAIKIYNPYGGKGWETRPEAERNLADAAVVEDFEDNREGNPRGMEVLGRYLYVAYFANDIGFNSSIDGTTRIVQYDMQNGFKKVNQFIYRPEDKDPDAAANAMDVVAYNGKIYGIYVGLSKKEAYGTGWFQLYRPDDSFVVEFDENLKPTGREVKIPSRAIYLGMNGGSRNYCLRGNKLFIAGQGEMMTNGYDKHTAISIVDLDKMTVTAPINGNKLDDTWNTPLMFVTATPTGDVYFIAAGYPMYNGNWYGKPDFIEVSDKQYVFKTSLNKMEEIGKLDAPVSMETLEAKGLVTKIWESTWEGNSQDDLVIDYDESTNCLWWNPGTGGVYRYNCDGKSAPVLIGERQFAIVTNILVANRVQAIPAPGNIEVAPVETPEFVVPVSADAQKVFPVIELFNQVSVEEKSAATGIASSDFVELPNGITVRHDILAKAANSVLEDGAAVISPLPIFDLNLSDDKKLAVVTFAVSGKDLYTTAPANVNLIKVKADGTGLKFNYAATQDDYKDGFFTILTEEDDVAVNIDDGKSYKLVLYIADNGEYDLDSAEHKITDPAFIVKKNEPISGGDSGSGSSGGGCNSGMGILALLTLVPAVVITRKKR